MDSNLTDTFTQKGFVIVPALFSAEILEDARADLSHLVDSLARRLLSEGKIEDAFEDAPFDKRLNLLFRDIPEQSPRNFRKELHLEGLFPLFFHPRLLDLAEQIIGPEIRLYPNYTARPKLPGNARTLVLWHQDGGYTGAEADSLRMVNVWAPLVPATIENGCMQFIPGSHNFGIAQHHSREHYLEIDEAVLNPLLDRAVDIEVEPGDVVLFHNLLFHQGLPNRSDTVRWSLDWRYQDATQDTQRTHKGHIARSRTKPEREVTSREEWAALNFQ
ncbi:MAG: phytanoyl-CoA dioxygenase family protein [Planctomycetota bacterium]|nr:phytanoyl-CoA dioxygenase family protein [Planctomycetota bacterium]MDA1141369.1 phytanoyl-CoA dioxygenase family protein [Planctomycetota bacterium]